MPMGKPVPAQDPVAHLAPISAGAARASNAKSEPAAPNGYSGGK
jgi:hypothetical protein